MAKNVRLYRKKLELTQEALAEKCSIIDETALSNRAFISDIENCRRNISIDLIGILAKALEREPFELFLEKDIGGKL